MKKRAWSARSAKSFLESLPTFGGKKAREPYKQSFRDMLTDRLLACETRAEVEKIDEGIEKWAPGKVSSQTLRKMHRQCRARHESLDGKS